MKLLHAYRSLRPHYRICLDLYFYAVLIDDDRPVKKRYLRRSGAGPIIDER